MGAWLLNVTTGAQEKRKGDFFMLCDWKISSWTLSEQLEFVVVDKDIAWCLVTNNGMNNLIPCLP